MVRFQVYCEGAAKGIYQWIRYRGWEKGGQGDSQVFGPGDRKNGVCIYRDGRAAEGQMWGWKSGTQASAEVPSVH